MYKNTRGTGTRGTDIPVTGTRTTDAKLYSHYIVMQKKCFFECFFLLFFFYFLIC